MKYRWWPSLWQLWLILVFHSFEFFVWLETLARTNIATLLLRLELFCLWCFCCWWGLDQICPLLGQPFFSFTHFLLFLNYWLFFNAPGHKFASDFLSPVKYWWWPSLRQLWLLLVFHSFEFVCLTWPSIVVAWENFWIIWCFLSPAMFKPTYSSPLWKLFNIFKKINIICIFVTIRAFSNFCLTKNATIMITAATFLSISAYLSSKMFASFTQTP